MKGTAIFVLSDMRSGSTLLDQLLGAHPSIISLGELHWLRAYILEDRTIYDPVHKLVCTCGQSVPNCGFWQQVVEALGQPLDELQLQPILMSRKRAKSPSENLSRLPTAILERFPIIYRSRLVQQYFGGSRLAADSVGLFDAVFRVSGRRFAVDSSKSTLRFRAIHDFQPRCSRAILLARDYRAVVHSKMKRGHSLAAAAIGWRKKMLQIEALTNDLPTESIHRLTYEALCTNPKRELSSICTFLGLPFAQVMLERPLDNIHHIGGSPSKLDSSKIAISMDTTYRSAFDADSLVQLRRLVGSVAQRWGY